LWVICGYPIARYGGIFLYKWCDVIFKEHYFFPLSQWYFFGERWADWVFFGLCLILGGIIGGVVAKLFDERENWET